MFENLDPRVKSAAKRLAPYAAVAVTTLVLTKKMTPSPATVVPLKLDLLKNNVVLLTMSDGLIYSTNLPDPQ